MKHIKEIIFFEDYGLWAKCGKAARVNKVPISDYIASCVEKVEKRADTPINYSEELYDCCEIAAKQDGQTIAQFIEACCQSEIGEKDIAEKAEKKKGDFFNLNRDVKKV